MSGLSPAMREERLRYVFGRTGVVSGRGQRGWEARSVPSRGRSSRVGHLCRMQAGACSEMRDFRQRRPQLLRRVDTGSESLEVGDVVMAVRAEAWPSSQRVDGRGQAADREATVGFLLTLPRHTKSDPRRTNAVLNQSSKPELACLLPDHLDPRSTSPRNDQRLDNAIMVRRDTETRGQCTQLYWRYTRTLLKYAHSYAQLIFSVLKTLQDQELTVELKNDLAITGQLKSVDQCVPNHCSRRACPLVLTSTAQRLALADRTGSSTSSWTTFACKTRSGIPIWCVLPERLTARLHRKPVIWRRGHCVLMGSHSDGMPHRWPSAVASSEGARSGTSSSREQPSTHNYSKTRRGEVRLPSHFQNAFYDPSAICSDHAADNLPRFGRTEAGKQR